MNSKTVLAIIVIGMLGTFAFMIMAMMGFQKLSEQPLVRACVEIADQYKVREVSLSVPPTGSPRTLRLGYETSLAYVSLDAQRDEMEGIAKTALEKVRAKEMVENLEAKRQRKAPPDRGPIDKVAIHRTWRSDRGCFKRSETVTHEWTAPPAPAK